jgi:hypothetical protein
MAPRKLPGQEVHQPHELHSQPFLILAIHPQPGDVFGVSVLVPLGHPGEHPDVLVKAHLVIRQGEIRVDQDVVPTMLPDDAFVVIISRNPPQARSKEG